MVGLADFRMQSCIHTFQPRKTHQIKQQRQIMLRVD